MRSDEGVMVRGEGQPVRGGGGAVHSEVLPEGVENETPR